MRGYVATTDFEWFAFLRARQPLEEVNFWQPSGGRRFRAIEPFEPFFFKLKAPHDVIGGYGFLAGHSVLPDWLAWRTFRELNGAPDHITMRRRIERYIPSSRRDSKAAYPVGCLMIQQPVLFAEDDWIPQPRDWSRNIVSGKAYDLAHGEGQRIWDACRERAQRRLVSEAGPRYGEPGLVLPRLGQGTFRIAVTDAYGRACAVTTEHSLPVLEAAHIVPYAEGGEHRVDNGLLLRTDIHRLFDAGYVTVTLDRRFEVSRELREQWQNGRTYYALHGQPVHVPAAATARPSPENLRWHNEHRFRG